MVCGGSPPTNWAGGAYMLELADPKNRMRTGPYVYQTT